PTPPAPGTDTTPQTLVSWNVGRVWSKRYGMLKEVSMVSSLPVNTRFRLRVEMGAPTEQKVILFDNVEIQAALTLRFQLREYTREEFEVVVQGVLVRREGISKEMAGYIAGVLSKLTKDVRDAIRIGRLCETKEEVDEFVKIIYCAKG
ncbi:unnamed protein product, partial [marine sediment metagenome]